MTGPQPNSAKPRPWQQGDEEAVSFGAWLRRHREVREITLREIADATKISMRYLEAFEEDRFEVLPAGVFCRGFLREYARYVGLDPDETVNRFLSTQHALSPQGDEEAEGDEARPAPSRANWIFGLLLFLALVVIIIVVGVLAFHGERQRGTAPEGEQSAPAAAVAPPPSEDGAESPAAGSPAAVALAAEPPPSPTAGESPEPPAAGTAPLTVTLDFTAECWVEIVLDGRRRIEELRVQGESLQLEAEESVALTLGNASGVDVRVNGMPYQLPTRGNSQVVRDVRIDLETARALVEGT
jgi:cytoskeleton protein RodZ